MSARTGVSASSGRVRVLTHEAAGVDDACTARVEHEQRVDVVGVLDDGERIVARLDQPDHGLAGRRLGPEPCGELGADQWTGDERAPELLEHQRRFRHPEADATVRFGDAQREHARVAQLAPTLAIEPCAVVLDAAHHLGPESALHEGTHSLLEGDLVVGELEVHRVPVRCRSEPVWPYRSRGRPSTRSPTMLRCTCDVPAAMLMRSAQKRACT